MGETHCCRIAQRQMPHLLCERSHDGGGLHRHGVLHRGRQNPSLQDRDTQWERERDRERERKKEKEGEIGRDREVTRQNGEGEKRETSRVQWERERGRKAKDDRNERIQK